MNPACAPFEADLSALLDGELDAARRAEVEQHLRGCARCRAEAAELRRVGESLRRWDAQESRCAPSTGFRNRVMARVAPPAAARPADPALRLWRGAAWAAAAAAGVLAVVAWNRAQPETGPSADLARIRAAVARAEADVADALRRGAPAPSDPAAAGPDVVRVDAPPPVVGPETPRSEIADRDESSDPWEARGDGMLLRDAVSEYDRFVNDRMRLALEERLDRIEHKDAAAQATTAAAPAPPPMAAFLGQATVAAPFSRDRVQVWPIEMTNAPRGGRVLLAESAIDERALSVREDAQGNVVAANDDLKGRTVLLLAGDVLRGGRRDRIVRESVLLAPGRRMSIPVVGASDAREGTTYRNFTRSRLLAPADVRALLAAAALGEPVSQDDVDSVVHATISDLASVGGENSLENLFTNPELQREVARYTDALRRKLDRPNVVGFALAVGSDLVGVEVCGDPETFRALRDRLVRSHVLHALSRPSDVAEGAPPADAEVQACLAAAGRALFTEGTPSGDGTLGLFRTVDGAVFGEGILDGTRLVHASVFAGLPAGHGPGGPAAGRGALGRAPSVTGGSPRAPGAAPDRSSGGSGGGGLDAR